MFKNKPFALLGRVAAGALVLAGLALPVAAQNLFSEAVGGMGLGSLPLLPGDTMNFARCLQGPKVIGGCASWDPCYAHHGGFGPGLILSYKKPVAVVEVTCKAGSSQLLGGPGLSKLADMALGTVVQQDCNGFNQQKEGNDHPRYYDVHIFRVTTAAYLTSAGGAAAAAAMTAACPSSMVGENLTTPLGLAANYGLIPVYLSELDPTWKNPLPTADGLLNNAVASSIGAAGTAAMEGFCFAAGLAATAGFAPPSWVDSCIGSWGLRSPVGGWTRHKTEPIAAMIAAARAYGRIATIGLVEREIPGLAPEFSLVYPPAHPMAPPGTGLRASGCYNEGTVNPMWYTKEEMLLPLDPATLMGSVSSLAGIGGVNKGYFVATYWRDTSCCRTACISTPYAPYF